MRRGDKTPDDLDRAEGNSLLENYADHDEAHAVFLDLVPPSISVETIGIDMRHDDGSEGLIYDDQPDLKLWRFGEPVALVDVKAKTSDEWLGLCNERHIHKYREAVEDHEVPAYIFFHSTESGTSFVCNVDGDVWLTTEKPFMLTFPDHNNAAYFPEETRIDVETFMEEIGT